MAFGEEPEDEVSKCEVPFGEFACLNLGSLPLILCSILLVLIVFILSLEHLFHEARAKAEKSKFWKAFWKAFEEELTILGVVSFILFLLAQGLSGANEESLENMITLIEFVHIILFVTMVFYLCLIAMAGSKAQDYVKKMRHQQAQFKRLQEAALDADTITVCEKVKDFFFFDPNNKELEAWSVGEEGEGEEEEHKRQEASPSSESAQDSTSYAQFALDIFKLSAKLKKNTNRAKARKYFSGSMLRVKSASKRGRKRKIDTFMVGTQFLMGDAFLASQGLPPDLPFDYVEYTSKVVTHMYIKLIHLGWRVWSVFLAVTILSAAFAGLWHKIHGNTQENTDSIFTDDPNNNENFTYFFMIVGVFLILNLNYCFHYGDETFVRLMKNSYDKKFGSGSTSSDVSMAQPFLSSTGEGSLTKTPVYKGKTLFENCCPCFSTRASKDKCRSAFMLSAPDFTMRMYQVTALYLGLLISLFITVFMFVDNATTLFWYSVFPLLITLRRFGFQSPKYASLRYFGSLAPPEILEPLVADAWERYARGERRINLENSENELIKEMYRMVLQ